VTEKTVLNYIEHMSGKVPQVITVERTTDSKYQFDLLVRAVRKRLRAKPTYIALEKQRGFMDRIKALLEEHNLFQSSEHPDQLYALEGFAGNWVSKLSPPPRTYVVAEVDGGELKAESFGRAYGKRRDILKVLSMLLETDRELSRGKYSPQTVDLSLRELVKLDWSNLSRFEEFEPYLRKAQIMGWSEERLGEELGSSDRGNLLTLIKRSDFKPVYDMLEKRGHLSIYSQLVQGLGELIHYRSLRLMGFDEIRTWKEMDLRDWRGQDLEEASKMLTSEDLRLMAERIVGMDGLVQRLGTLGLQLLILNAPIRVKK